jgi:hypothetical protein
MTTSESEIEATPRHLPAPRKRRDGVRREAAQNRRLEELIGSAAGWTSAQR